MRNLIFHLKSRLKPTLKPAQPDHFQIFIDESILYEQHEEKMLAQRFITAFYMINFQDIKELNQQYCKIIYATNVKHEKKSNQVSDQTNRQALIIAQKYLTQAMILERKAYDYAKFGGWKKNMFLSLELMSYIDPIKEILRQLKHQVLSSKVIVDVIIDQTSQNCIDPCLTLNKELLHKLAIEASDQQTNFEVNYQTADSKENYGIQVADMFAGAYRKELVYCMNDEPVELIPFAYHKKVLDEKLNANTDFLQVLGQVVYEQIPNIPFPSSEIKTNPSQNRHEFNFHPILVIATFFRSKYLLFISSNNLFLETDIVLKRLTAVTDEMDRSEIISLCIALNNQLTRIAKNLGLKPQNYAMTLSKKVTAGPYQKTIKNMRSNVRQLREKSDNVITRKIIARKLKTFNRKISRYC